MARRTPTSLGGERRRRVLIGTTSCALVLLESEWVLRSVYGLAGTEVASALRAFAGLPGLAVESAAVLAKALDCAEKGMDFADALHLGTAARCEALLTFDLPFIEQAGENSVRVMEP